MRYPGEALQSFWKIGLDHGGESVATILSRSRRGGQNRRHCVCQPWLTTSDCPVKASERKAAKKTATSAMSFAITNQRREIRPRRTLVLHQFETAGDAHAAPEVLREDHPSHGVFGCHGEMTHGRDPHEARRRCPVVGDAQQTATGTDRGQDRSPDPDLPGRHGREVDEVTQVDLVRIESRGVRQDTRHVLVDRRRNRSRAGW